MTESDKGTNKNTATTSAAASKARQATDKATAPASRAAKSAAATTDAAASAAKSGAGRAADVTSRAAQTATKGVEVSRQAIISASGQVAAGAKTAWTVLAHRKLVAAGVGAGLTALSAASFAVGRRAASSSHGPLTRLTGGRF